MDAATAEAIAEDAKMRLGAASPVRVHTYAIPSSRGYLRRAVSWSILIVTDAAETHVRDALPEHDVEFLARKGARLAFIAWPKR